eukprot:COSAG01_NODE_3516_length_5981_cov_5.929446_9_plen_82_part_00
MMRGGARGHLRHRRRSQVGLYKMCPCDSCEHEAINEEGEHDQEKEGGQEECGPSAGLGAHGRAGSTRHPRSRRRGYVLEGR